jgi:hypothetical protein
MTRKEHVKMDENEELYITQGKRTQKERKM